MKHAALLITFTVSLLSPLTAAPRKSLLDSDPDVIYLKDHVKHIITLLTAQPVTVYSTKKGGRRLGAFKANTKVELLAMTEKAYRVKGQASQGGVTGWVDPKLLASKDKNFIANLKQLYERQMIITELIANKEVAIGMTLEEVSKSLGKPTETEIKQTRKGESGKWDYVESVQQKHYRTVVDHNTGQVYRQLSHVTTEEKSRTTVEFDQGVVTAVTRKRNNGPGKVRIIPAPVVFNW
ncbi:MAG: hypothetical protein QNL01_13775 [Akkermansiaceae bacterium]|jgi:outer membrane protein assembly factor BamE (lipoprotein component of BamABCDE complex)|tara:strand:- start:9383 stop:10093 length:711 start_codon:yes stop_codon:yes gene_type:complete